MSSARTRLAFKRPAGGWFALVWDVAAAVLLLALPLLVFFRHNDYPLLRAETAACFAWVALAGLGWGLLMWAGRTAARVLVTTLLLVLVVDVQTDWLTVVGLRLLLNVAGFGALCWLLRRRLSRVVVIVAGAMVLATLVQAPGRMLRHQGTYPAPGDPSLPFVLHLILDEYAAPEALDRTFDEDGATAAAVEDFLVGHDFTLFSRCYSRLFNTDESIPNILNRGLSTAPKEFWPGHFRKGALLERNDWFARLADLGYGLHVFQSDFITYLAPDAAGGLPPRTSRSDYTLETVHALAGTQLTVGEKVRFIFGSYYRLSWLLGLLRDGYGDLRRGAVGRALPLPAWDEAGDRVSTLATMQAMDELERLLEDARPGQAVFAHLLLPHFPYAYGEDCGLEPMGSRWLNAFDENLAPGRNDEASRAARYPLYLAQLRCTNLRLAEIFGTLRQAGRWENSLVILHGDHGSRLNRLEPVPANADLLSPEDQMDAFGTLLAVKWPAGTGAVDRRQVPLDDVFEQLFLDPAGSWPPAAYEAPPLLLAEPWVLLNDGEQLLQRQRFPGFAAGRAPAPPLEGQ